MIGWNAALIIIGLIAAGVFVGYLVAITMRWLVNKINAKFAEKRVKNVIVADMENLVENSNNKISLNELNDITGGRRAEVIAAVDGDNRIVGDIEIAKDKNRSLDPEVEELLGREKSVVVGA